MAADRVPVRQVLAHKKRRKENLMVIAASGLHKAKGGHYDIKSESCIISHPG